MKNPHVTDHALRRYLERVRGFKFDKEVSQIQDICRGVENGTVKAFGHRFEIENWVVITIAPVGEDQRPNRTKRQNVGSAL
jgi:hypothetical protein